MIKRLEADENDCRVCGIYFDVLQILVYFCLGWIPPGSGITFTYKPTGLFWSIAAIPLIWKPFKYANSP